ncbi:MAG: transposase [Akkermansiaceae bacterium]|nr:transposase [Akkermansiaceae bacterium]
MLLVLRCLASQNTTNHATTNCRPAQLEFLSCQGRKVQADFKGRKVGSDGGVLLLRKVDKTLNLLSRAARLFKDDRDQNKVVHTQDSQLKQRVFALAQGHEDLNDHDHLRYDILLQTAAQKTSPLASAPATLPVYGPLRVRRLVPLDSLSGPDVNRLPEWRPQEAC